MSLLELGSGSQPASDDDADADYAYEESSSSEVGDESAVSELSGFGGALPESVAAAIHTALPSVTHGPVATEQPSAAGTLTRKTVTEPPSASKPSKVVKDTGDYHYEYHNEHGVCCYKIVVLSAEENLWLERLHYVLDAITSVDGDSSDAKQPAAELQSAMRSVSDESNRNAYLIEQLFARIFSLLTDRKNALLRELRTFEGDALSTLSVERERVFADTEALTIASQKIDELICDGSLKRRDRRKLLIATAQTALVRVIGSDSVKQLSRHIRDATRGRDGSSLLGIESTAIDEEIETVDNDENDADVSDTAKMRKRKEERKRKMSSLSTLSALPHSKKWATQRDAVLGEVRRRQCAVRHQSQEQMRHTIQQLVTLVSNAPVTEAPKAKAKKREVVTATVTTPPVDAGFAKSGAKRSSASDSGIRDGIGIAAQRPKRDAHKKKISRIRAVAVDAKVERKAKDKLRIPVESELFSPVRVTVADVLSTESGKTNVESEDLSKWKKTTNAPSAVGNGSDKDHTEESDSYSDDLETEIPTPYFQKTVTSALPFETGPKTKHSEIHRRKQERIALMSMSPLRALENMESKKKKKATKEKRKREKGKAHTLSSDGQMVSPSIWAIPLVSATSTPVTLAISSTTPLETPSVSLQFASEMVPFLRMYRWSQVSPQSDGRSPQRSGRSMHWAVVAENAVLKLCAEGCGDTARVYLKCDAIGFTQLAPLWSAISQKATNARSWNSLCANGSAVGGGALTAFAVRFHTDGDAMRFDKGVMEADAFNRDFTGL